MLGGWAQLVLPPVSVISCGERTSKKLLHASPQSVSNCWYRVTDTAGSVVRWTVAVVALDWKSNVTSARATPVPASDATTAATAEIAIRRRTRVSSQADGGSARRSRRASRSPTAGTSATTAAGSRGR